jgi:hypothetical protein
VRPRQDALKAGALLVALSAALPGCGAVFHASQTVTFAARPEDKAVVYSGGVSLPKGDQAGTYSTRVFLNNAGGHVAAAPGKKVANVTPGRHVDAIAIVCDVLWSLTIVGIAAPISDGLLGTFVKTEPLVEIALEPDGAAAAENPMPVYSVGDATVAATPENADAAPPAAGPPAADPSAAGPPAAVP